MRVHIDAPAKVNLRLVVLARETTGFHSLETLFCAVSLGDTITIESGEPGLRLEGGGDHSMGPPDRNLVVRAARLFYERSGLAPSVTIRIEKRIPVAAGLGGGSSDAAATLRALEHLHGAPVGKPGLLECGATLGSDVPFFLTQTPYALGWSRGHRLLSLPPLPPRHVLIARPDVDMPTPALFRRLAEVREGAPAPGPSVFSADQVQDWSAIRTLARNDFHSVAGEWIPDFDRALGILSAAGADLALLSGSGSAIFGVFDGPDSAAAAQPHLESSGFRCWPAVTLRHWPEPRSEH